MGFAAEAPKDSAVDDVPDLTSSVDLGQGFHAPSFGTYWLEEEEEEEDFCLSPSLLSAWCELSLRSSGRSRLGLKLTIGSVVEICELVRNHLCFQLIQLIEVVSSTVILERTRLCP